MRAITQPDHTIALLIEEAKRMEFAREITSIASWFDDNKSRMEYKHVQDEAIVRSQQLHNIAKELAAERVDEIYASKIDLGEDEIEQARRLLGSSVEVDA